MLRKTSSEPPKKILCVDDDPGILSMTRNLLELTGYEVETASCGQRALDQVRGQFDLVIVDYNLPDFNGDVVAQRWKQEQPSVPILMMSGNLDLPDHALDHVNAYLMKGSGVRALVGAISALTESIH